MEGNNKAKRPASEVTVASPESAEECPPFKRARPASFQDTQPSSESYGAFENVVLGGPSSSIKKLTKIDKPSNRESAEEEKGKLAVIEENFQGLADQIESLKDRIRQTLISVDIKKRAKLLRKKHKLSYEVGEIQDKIDECQQMLAQDPDDGSDLEHRRGNIELELQQAEDRLMQKRVDQFKLYKRFADFVEEMDTAASP